MTKDLTSLKEKVTGTAPAPVTKEKTIADYINQMTPEIAKALPKHCTAERIARIALTAIRVNPKLALCNRESLLAGIMTGAQLGLEINTPLQHAYLIPYKRKTKNDKGQWFETTDAQFQIGYQGLLDLAYRTGLYQDIYVEEVYTKDKFKYTLGLSRSIEHEPCEDDDRGELRCIYAVYHLKTGGYDFKVWSAAKIRKHAEKYSKSFFNGVLDEKSAWASNFSGMGKKTVLKDLLKCAPKSIEFMEQLSADEKIKTEITENMLEAPAILLEETPAEIEAVLEQPDITPEERDRAAAEKAAEELIKQLAEEKKREKK